MATFFMQEYATSYSYSKEPSGGVSCQGWVIGRDCTQLAPIYVREFALLHGCILALQLLRRSD